MPSYLNKRGKAKKYSTIFPPKQKRLGGGYSTNIDKGYKFLLNTISNIF